MTIEVNYNPIRQQGNGVTTQFSYDFYALSDQYLVVYIEEDGVQTVTTDYTATVSETGGIVTFNVAPTENQYVVITRSTTINQEVPYTTSRGFDAKVVESSFDKDIAISQELQNQLTRTPKLPEGYNYNIQLPNPDDGKALVWNGNQGVIRNSDYTLEESMARAAASAELSKDWAEKTTGLVSGDFSSKAYAIGGTGTETNNAKYYATQAANSADIAYAAATNENVVAVGTDLRTDNNIGAVVGNATNINNVAGNETNINNVASNRTNINTVAGSIASVNTNATNINAINTNASNISAIQSAYSNAQSALNSKNKAQEWAISENIVDNIDYSAKHYAEVASQHENPLRIGQIIESTIPLTDAGLHLLDGSVIQGNGIYSDFYTHMVEKWQTYPQIFAGEQDWQNHVATYGVCGKFVLDEANRTIRLPLITGFIEGTNDYNDLLKFTQAGVPNITSGDAKVLSWKNDTQFSWTEGALQSNETAHGGLQDNAGNWTGSVVANFNASRSSSIYGNSNTVQPQSIKVLYYIVIATSTKTDIEVDIDEIATDLNGKADTDLSNINTSGKSFASGLAMPSSRYIDLTLGASGSTYTAPANGYVALRFGSNSSSGIHYVHIIENNTNRGNTLLTTDASLVGLFVSLPIKKGNKFVISHGQITSEVFRFYYAEGEA